MRSSVRSSVCSTSIAVVLGREMSLCLSTLDPVAKTEYFAEIQLVSLTASEDPYEMWKEGKFEEDVTLLSLPESNLCNGKGWKLTCIIIFKAATCSGALMAYVNPNQSSPESVHHSWVAVKFDGDVITCT